MSAAGAAWSSAGREPGGLYAENHPSPEGRQKFFKTSLQALSAASRAFVLLCKDGPWAYPRRYHLTRLRRSSSLGSQRHS